MTLTRTRVAQLTASFANRRILVLGDVMLDQFIWGRVRRISPEAPVPVVEVARESYHPGGAANVAANVQALGGAATPVGLVGDDFGGERIADLLRSEAIDTTGLLAEAGRPTTLKTRIVAHNQQIVRADRESRTPLSNERNAELARVFLAQLATAHAVVVSDYDKGVVNRDLLARVLPEVRRAGLPVLLDPKVHHADYYRPITLITPNQREAELLTGVSIDNETHLQEAGRLLLERFDCAHALITRGEEGMSLFSRSGAHHFPTVAREVFDVTGAGDTAIATLALGMASGASVEESVIMANHAAGIVVGKIGTATATAAELLSDFDSADAHPPG